MARILSLIFLVILVLFGLSFAVMNAQDVQLSYYFFGQREVPLALTLVLTMAFGAFIGFLFSLGMLVKFKREVYRLRRQIRVAEQEIGNLRAIPIKDVH